jgi:hypothetical protein
MSRNADTQYLNDLLRMAQQEMEGLRYDFMNASTHFSLQAACQKLFDQHVTLLHHVILDTYQRLQQDQRAAQPAPAPAPAPAQPPVPAGIPVARPVVRPAAQAPVVVDLPPPVPIGQPGLSPSLDPSIPSAPPVQPGIANVFVTAQGTRVIAPDGSRAVLPPGAPVTPDLVSPAPPVPPPAPPGVQQVVLPPGGGISPDVAAAIANRSTDQPQ